ncbi:Rpn family recombination-promoting nuclease/putative transposase [Desulfonema magnum]|uniref:Transposase, RpnA-like n=1 Tax=Desulfonema magnum TaxID=45655 RepID=A0A975BK89_9BACT|nr:Rpn family recombination-promoting nuclease/putative transposase [Desulfonema magnum]QTA86931.1 Putative transposase, RpnA-like [Desulfonema magnum]
MKFLLTPRLDFVFKKLFTQDTEILTDLVNCVLDLPGDRQILSVEVRNPAILPEELTKKFIILDIRATDDQNRHYDIEMQVRRYASYSKRILYYLSRMYSEQLESGEDYETLRPVIGIHFLDYTEFPEYEKTFHFRFELRDRNHPALRLTEDMCLHLFELPKLRRMTETCGNKNLLEWLHFFNHAHEEGDKKMREHYTNPKVWKAFDVLEKLSADDITRQHAEMREKALKDEVSMLAAAERKGMEKKGRETARSLIVMGKLSPDEIAQVTGLSLNEVRELRENEGTSH